MKEITSGPKYKELIEKTESIISKIKDKFPELYHIFLLSEIVFIDTEIKDKYQLEFEPPMKTGFNEKTNRIIIYINANIFDYFTDEQIIYIYLHELFHHIFLHFKRTSFINNHLLANICADLEINSFLGNIDLPILFPKNYNLPDNKTLEYYYSELVKILENIIDKSNNKEQDIESKNNEEQDTESKDNGKNTESKNKLKEKLSEKEKKKEIREKIKKEIDKLRDEILKGKHIIDYFFPDDEKNKNISEKIRKKYVEIKTQTYQYGTKEDENLRKILKNIETKQIWEKAILNLDKIVETNIQYTYKRPSLHYPYPYIAPYVYKEKIIQTLIFIDASGSINDLTLNKFLYTIKLGSANFEILDLFSFDTKLYKIENWKIAFARNKFDDIEILGGGGTSFNPIFEILPKYKSCNSVIIFTDSWGEIDLNLAKKFSNITFLWIIDSSDTIYTELLKLPKNHLLIKVKL